MISKEQAKTAQQKLVMKLKGAEWLRGIGITRDVTGSFGIKVNVQRMTDEVRRSVPSDVDGVPVEIAAVGDFEAQ